MESIVILTVLETFSQVFLRRYTDVLDKAAQTWRTPLKLWRQRAMSATAAHFSIATTRPETVLLRCTGCRRQILIFHLIIYKIYSMLAVIELHLHITLVFIIIIISLPQSTAGYRPLQCPTISLYLRLLASSSCQPSCANRHSTKPEGVLNYVYLDTVSTPELVYPIGCRFYGWYGLPTATSACFLIRCAMSVTLVLCRITWYRIRSCREPPSSFHSSLSDLN
jgi:hypothetical protein